MVNVADGSVFVSVTESTVFDEPTGWLPKERLVGVAVRPAHAGA